MMTIRCTRDLLKLLDVEVKREPNPSINSLSDFYAKLVSTRRARLAIPVSERSLLPVLVAAPSDRRMFVVAFRQTLRSVLLEIGAELRSVKREAQEADQIALGKTASRRILGSLNDLGFLASAMIEDNRHIDLLALAVELADTPCSPLKYETPKSVTLALLRRWFQ